MNMFPHKEQENKQIKGILINMKIKWDIELINANT